MVLHNKKYKWNYLQTQQIIAFGKITGCVAKSDINKLHKEDEMLPVKANRKKYLSNF